ncbi:hypothetical protein Salat_0518900 [Sesamum alatum]|uniref:Zinc knuckle CX2CX4HX4C domain-containing protein n=1 Tax=Sesamum alatum TaxID=300844 RepID=A0AAE1Z431_9LAMI|nr:hypothetical protein Salat_0518900 [Sesamum alatum]
MGWTADSESHHLYLVGRLLLSKQPKFDALVASARSMLNPVKGLEMKSLAEGRFLIRFNHILDCNRALEGWPLSFEKNTLVLNGIGARSVSGYGSWRATLCICVALNVTLPLVRALRLCTTSGEDLLVSFTYERLQNFCYLCGRLGHGHISIYCKVRFEEGFQDPGDDSPYRQWLRALANS